MYKKGDMSLNIIVVAALALIVLVVLTAIFVGRMNTTADKTGKNDKVALDKVCMQPRDGIKQSKCVSRTQCIEDGWSVLTPPAGTSTGGGDWMDCPVGDDNKVCCVIRNT